MSAPDPKPAARKVATRAEWDVLRAQKLGPCRVCRDTYQIELHHLVPRSLGGDDVAANLIPLCHLCHTRYEGREDKLVAHYIRNTLTRDEFCYVGNTKGIGFLLRYYPILPGDAPPSSQGGIAGEDKPEGAIGTPLSAHDTGRDPESSPTNSEPGALRRPSGESDAATPPPIRKDGGSPGSEFVARYTDPQSASVYRATIDARAGSSAEEREPSKLRVGGSTPPQPLSEPGDFQGPSGESAAATPPPIGNDGGALGSEHSHDEQEPCTACKGTGRRRKRSASKPRGQRFSIAIPVAEPDGKDALANDIRWCGDALNLELGYTAETPPYYILRAVLQDWRDRFSTRGAKNSA